MADTFSKKEREKKRSRKKKEKAERKQARKEEGTQGDVMVYVDQHGNFTETKPKYFGEEDSDVKLEDIEVGVPKDSESTDEKEEGYVKFYNQEKGFGFIKGGRKVGEIYFSSPDETLNLRDNDKVRFEVGSGDNGSFAFNIEKIQ